jgi:hypothetical protein
MIQKMISLMIMDSSTHSREPVILLRLVDHPNSTLLK